VSPTDIVNAFIAAVERKDIEAAVAHLAPSVSYENVPIAPIAGSEAVAEALAGFLGGASEVDWRIERQVEVGNVVVNERVDRFKIGDGWLELPVAGFFEIDGEGKITLWRDYFDMGSYRTQMAKLSGD
jgi:limonene-1,2-epoxide hydrolase